MSHVFPFRRRAAKARRHDPPRILVVDDEPNVRMTIQMTLAQAGYDVEAAADGPAGLSAFGDGRAWDLVLLDQRMPGMDGLQVLREIRRRDAGAKTIMVTAFGTVDLAVEAMKAGATDFLRKPLTTDTLRNATEAVLQRTPDPAAEAQAVTPADAPSAPLTFGITTVNGFRIESTPDPGQRDSTGLVHAFIVRSPSGEARVYAVRLPAYAIELVKAHADREEMPAGDRFWQGLCEEVLANHLWQEGGFPDDATLEVDDLTPGMRRWVEAVLSAVQ